MRDRPRTLHQGAGVALVVVISGLALFLWPSCSREPHDISVEEATALLRRAEAYASMGDAEKLCGMGGSVSLCMSWWHNAGAEQGVPNEHPKIVDSFVLQTADLDGQKAIGGRVLVVEGVDGNGKAYRTDFFVFDAGSHGLVPYLPVYWSGVSMRTAGGDGGSATAPRA